MDANGNNKTDAGDTFLLQVNSTDDNTSSLVQLSALGGGQYSASYTLLHADQDVASTALFYNGYQVVDLEITAVGLLHCCYLLHSGSTEETAPSN